MRRFPGDLKPNYIYENICQTMWTKMNSTSMSAVHLRK